MSPNELTLCDEDDEASSCGCLPLQLKTEECANDAPSCFASCTKTADCNVDRAFCAPSKVNETDDTVAARTCVQTCLENGQCQDDELCARLEDKALANYPFCASRQAVENTDGLDEYVCVDASALDHLRREELVYAEHVMARVLCDAQGACATPGHVVRFNGRAMMMRSYCAAVGGCARDVMLVNSPRYRRGLMVGTKTQGLEFTAFAARFETRVEEHVLATAVHLGL